MDILDEEKLAKAFVDRVTEKLIPAAKTALIEVLDGLTITTTFTLSFNRKKSGGVPVS